MNQPIDARMTLKLNAPVLNALFPEGTEARAELAQSVIQEFARAYIKNTLTQEAKDFLERLTKEVASNTSLDNVVRQYFESSTKAAYWSNMELKLKNDGVLHRLISSAVQSAFDNRFVEMINDAATKAVAGYVERLESSVDYAVKERAERLTADAINSRVNAAVEAARQTL